MEEQNTNRKVPISKRLLAVLIAAVCLLAAVSAVAVVYLVKMERRYGSLEQLAEAVDSKYYQEVDEDSAMDGAKKGYVAGLDDPYSQYMTKEEYQSYQTTEAGQTVGIGVTVIQTEDGYLEIQEVTADSPAEEAGLQAKDVIMAVEGSDVAELGYEAAIEAVKGEENTSVTLTIRRDEQEQDYTVQRKSMEVVSVTGQMLENHIGYISIRSFKKNTPDQFQALYDQLLEDGATALVFDLRDNGGGQVSALEQILDPLLPEGVIAIATYRDGSTETLVESDATECNLPMAVIVNGNTASAAELFTASLQDFEKATVVGTTTFGKGIMQVTQEMPDGGALTLTTATYQTTRGECYHGVGVSPDITVEAGDTAVDDEAPDASTDPQLKKAMEVVTEQ